jgi:tRNA A-37 threonylcarbamoyl transferase component Bud32
MPIRCDHCLQVYDSGYQACPFCGYVIGDDAAEIFYLKPGTILQDRFAVGQVLGYGGFGIIYKTWDHIENKVIAVKEYFPSGVVTRIPGKKDVKLLSDNLADAFQEGRKRFLDEARNTAKLGNHPNIVKITGEFQENNTVYYTMEFLEGKSLTEYLKENIKISVENGVGLILSICDAVKTIHRAGILHRDISPDNIIIPPDFPSGAVKLIDFGAARFSADEKVTLNQQIMKPGYSPPEQYLAKNRENEQIDIYALGATLFHILTGEKPEESTNRKVVDNIPVPGELNNEIPEHVSNAILKAMAVDLHLRFKTVDEFVQALTGKVKVQAPETEMKKRRTKRRISMISIATLLLAGLFTVLLGYFQRKDAATLPDASINMWFVVTGDAQADSSKARALEAILEEFGNAYPNVSVSLKGIEQAQYEKEVLAAIRRGDSPVVLESAILSREILSKTPDISNIARKESQNCYFLNLYARYFPDKNQLPVGFNAPAVYINPELSSYDGYGVGNLNELLATIPADTAMKGISLNEACRDSFEAVLSGNYTLAERDSYFNGETGIYLSDTSEFYEIQQRMPARYKMLYFDSDIIHAQFSGLWSLLPCKGNERKACERLLRYLLSETAQDHLHVQNQSGALPLNRRVLDLYKSIYGEFGGFFVRIDNYSFN